jgi:uncharacterized repeat protein (TIGR01451 family)
MPMPMRPRESRPPRRWRWVFAALFSVAAQVAPALAGDDSGGGATVAATGSGPLETTVEVQRLVSEEEPDGARANRFVEAHQLAAGEQVYYTVRVTNPGREPVKGIVVTKRLPYGVEYVPGSATGPACVVELSLNGGATFAPAGGKGAYTHLRWTCGHPLAPGATALLRFRAVFL